ncbi:MAG: hypothetical protein ACFE8M_09040 [Candidatus Hermodarchaeota archaeon]
MTEEENLLKKIEELKKELDRKDNEVIGYVDKIDYLEEEIMKLHELMSEPPSKKKSKKLKESKLQNELDAKDREIRELKDRMGFLRKDKLEAQKKLDNLKLQEKSTSVIRVEELREKAPLNNLVKELQDKINKQESIIRKLKLQNIGSSDFSEILREKEEEIESLKLQVTKLNQKIEKKKSITEIGVNDSTTAASTKISKNLLEDLQNKLNKTKRENTELKQKLDSYKDKTKFKNKIKDYENKISEFRTKLENKETEIQELREQRSLVDDPSQSPTLKQVVEELKTKLNKSKSQISILQEQLKAFGNQKVSNEAVPQSNIDTNLKIQREMASFLQQQLDEAKNTLKTKDEEITTIKNEAIRIKRSYEDLENQIRLKDKKISELMNNINKLSIAAETRTLTQKVENPQLKLRIEELKTVIEDLTKQNIEQRLEIDQLRKSI